MLKVILRFLLTSRFMFLKVFLNVVSVVRSDTTQVLLLLFFIFYLINEL